MPSPFPGMNPFLEQNYDWLDFHNEFISKTRESLRRLVGKGYFIKVEHRLILRERSAKERRYIGRGDVAIGKSRRPGKVAEHTTLSSPVRLQLPAVLKERHRFLEIRDIRDRQLVTVIELLSPSNKTPGDDYDDYLAKRREMLASAAHFVEIDLLRGGTRPSPPELPKSDYYVLVSRRQDRPNVDAWPFGLRDPLPIVPIPLSEPDPDVHLDLKMVLDNVYDAAGFGDHIYEERPKPALSPKDLRWAQAIVSRELE